jgi:acetyl-CoA carboxylase carboxyltransferase component
MVESAGANLPDQAKIFNYGGANFREITRRSKEGIPTISIVFGNSTAGGAYIPGMSDYVIMVKNEAKVFLAGPPLLKWLPMKLQMKKVWAEQKCTAPFQAFRITWQKMSWMQLRLAREIVSNLKHQQEKENLDIKEPLYDKEEILGVVSADIRIPFDQRELIARIVDGSEFSEFKPLYGSTYYRLCKCQWFQNWNYSQQRSVCFPDAANKGAQFIQLCNQNNTPLLFLQNITGFMVGKKYEEEGIIKTERS